MATNTLEASELEELKTFTPEDIRYVQENFQTPVYLYDQKLGEKKANNFLNFPNAFGLKVRYAMKANPGVTWLRLFTNLGLYIDASTGYEVIRAIAAGVPPENIQLTSQEFPHGMEEILNSGIMYNATSLDQLERYGKLRPGTEVSVRINPGRGSGGTKRTNTGGRSSSFGIWHEYIEDIKKIAEKYNLKVTKLHTHIGSGSDPKMWTKISKMSLALVKDFPDVHTLNLGGGIKEGRMRDDESADLQIIGEEVKKNFIKFSKQTGRELKLEIEPGTALMANVGVIVATVRDLVDTGLKGYTIIKANSGMNENSRVGFYGAQHPIIVINDSGEIGEYIVAGPCCESGDVSTVVKGQPEKLAKRSLNTPKIGDPIVFGGAGAYCESMSVGNYNSIPLAGSVLKTKRGRFLEIRVRQTIADMIKNERKVIRLKK